MTAGRCGGEIGTGLLASTLERRKVPLMKTREEQIRYRAHLIWLAEGKPDGRDSAHWKQAEEIVDQMPSIVPDPECEIEPADVTATS